MMAMPAQQSEERRKCSGETAALSLSQHQVQYQKKQEY